MSTTDTRAKLAELSSETHTDWRKSVTRLGRSLESMGTACTL